MMHTGIRFVMTICKSMNYRGYIYLYTFLYLHLYPKIYSNKIENRRSSKLINIYRIYCKSLQN